MASWSKVLVEWTFSRQLELKGLIYTALVKVGFCPFNRGLKSCSGRNGVWAVWKWQNRRRTMWTIQKQSIHKMIPRWWLFSPVISWFSQRLCNPFVGEGHIGYNEAVDPCMARIFTTQIDWRSKPRPILLKELTFSSVDLDWIRLRDFFVPMLLMHGEFGLLFLGNAISHIVRRFPANRHAKCECNSLNVVRDIAS